MARGKFYDPNELKRMSKRFEEALVQVGVNTEAGVKQFLDEVGQEADQITPINTRALIDSRYVVVETQGGQIVGEIGYDRNGEAPYAVYVHEMDKNYKTNNPKGQWKFLQMPLMRKKNELLKKIQERKR